MVFLEIFLFNIGSGICHPAAPVQCLTDRSFGKQTIVEVICSYFQRSQVLDELFPPLMHNLP
jgi:hypothetical protein